MAEYWASQGPNILYRSDVASIEHRARLRGDHQILAGPGTCAPGDGLLDEFRNVRLRGTGAPNERDRILDDVVRHRNAPHQILQNHDSFRGEHLLERHLP